MPLFLESLSILFSRNKLEWLLNSSSAPRFSSTLIMVAYLQIPDGELLGSSSNKLRLHKKLWTKSLKALNALGEKRDSLEWRFWKQERGTIVFFKLIILAIACIGIEVGKRKPEVVKTSQRRDEVIGQGDVEYLKRRHLSQLSLNKAQASHFSGIHTHIFIWSGSPLFHCNACHNRNSVII